MNRTTNSRVIQDVSALVAAILPIAQLFFNQLPSAFDKLFLAKEQFVGISILTLIVSYILIIFYQAKPWFEFILPFQQKRQKQYNEYYNKLNLLNELKSSLTGAANQEAALKEITKKYNENKLPNKKLRKISSDNLITLSTVIVLITTLAFITLALLPTGKTTTILQAILYVVLVAFAALTFTIYKKLRITAKSGRKTPSTAIKRQLT